MRLNIKENGRFIIWKVVNILIHLLTEILAYCKALKVKISVHSNFPYRFTHSDLTCIDSSKAKKKVCGGGWWWVVKTKNSVWLRSISDLPDLDLSLTKSG